MEYEVEGARPRGRPKKLGEKLRTKERQACKLNREDSMNHNRWRKQIWDIIDSDHDMCEWVNVYSGTGSPKLSRTKSRQS